jgi:hypothetical protein
MHSLSCQIKFMIKKIYLYEMLIRAKKKKKVFFFLHKRDWKISCTFFCLNNLYKLMQTKKSYKLILNFNKFKKKKLKITQILFQKFNVLNSLFQRKKIIFLFLFLNVTIT